jgi:hypothetical protein
MGCASDHVKSWLTGPIQPTGMPITRCGSSPCLAWGSWVLGMPKTRFGSYRSSRVIGCSSGHAANASAWSKHDAATGGTQESGARRAQPAAFKIAIGPCSHWALTCAASSLLGKHREDHPAYIPRGPATEHLIRRYLSSVRGCPTRFVSWHDRYLAVRSRSPGPVSRSFGVAPMLAPLGHGDR